MNAGVWVALFAALVGNAIAFGATLIKIGRLGERIDLLWAWYLAEHGFERAVDYRAITPQQLRPRIRRPAAPAAGDQLRDAGDEPTR